VAAVAGFLIFLGYWAYSDSHNDLRYVDKATYASDKSATAGLEKEKWKGVDEAFSAQREMLREIQKDIREIRNR